MNDYHHHYRRNHAAEWHQFLEEMRSLRGSSDGALTPRQLAGRILAAAGGPVPPKPKQPEDPK